MLCWSFIVVIFAVGEEEASSVLSFLKVGVLILLEIVCFAAGNSDEPIGDKVNDTEY